MAQLANRGRQVLAVIAGRQVGQALAVQVYQAGRDIVVQACLAGQVLAGRLVGLAKWGRQGRQVGLAFRAGRGLVAIAGQACLAGRGLVAIAGQACLAGRVLVAIAGQACLVGQAIRGRKGHQVIVGFRAGQGRQAIAGQACLVGQAIRGRQGRQVLAVGLAK